MQKLMGMERPNLKTDIIFREPSKKANQPTELSFSMTNATMWEISRNCKPQVKVFMKTLEMDIAMKDNGKKTCSMVTEYKNIQTLINMRESSCLEANLGREDIDLPMDEPTRVHSTTGILMAMGRSPWPTDRFMKANGNLGRSMEKEHIVLRMEKNM